MRSFCNSISSFVGASIVLVVALLLGSPSGLVTAQEHPAAPAEHGAAAGHGGEAHGDANPMTFDVDLAWFTFAVFAILFFILAKFAWKPMAEALDKREKTISDQIAAAERTYGEAQNLLAQYESKLSASQDEVRSILEKARHDAAHTSQEIIAKASAEATGVVERGKREIETATTQALNELAEKSARLAVELAGRIVRAEVNSDGHARLIQEALSKFPVSN